MFVCVRVCCIMCGFFSRQVERRCVFFSLRAREGFIFTMYERVGVCVCVRERERERAQDTQLDFPYTIRLFFSLPSSSFPSPLSFIAISRLLLLFFAVGPLPPFLRPTGLFPRRRNFLQEQISFVVMNISLTLKRVFWCVVVSLTMSSLTIKDTFRDQKLSTADTEAVS